MSRHCLIFITVFLNCVSGNAATPTSKPAKSDPPDFFEGFRSARYMLIAFDLQSQSPADRLQHLKDIAGDRARPYDAFVLCRMLFQEKGGGSLRRPNLGGPSFVVEETYSPVAYRRWPLEPITLCDQMPILVVDGYAGSGGPPEDALDYVVYCNTFGTWRSEKYDKFALARRREIVQAFVAPLRGLTKGDKDWLLAQAEDE